MFNKDIFIIEAHDLINTLEKAVLAVEEGVEQKELVQEIFRVMHSLKGSASMYGYDQIGNVTHELETLYDNIRNNIQPLTTDIVDVTFSCIDIFREILDNEDIDEDENFKVRYKFLFDKINQLVSNSPEEVNTQPEEKIASTFYVKVKFEENVLNSGINVFYLLDDLLEKGKYRVRVHTDSIPDNKSFNPESCYLWWELIIVTEESKDDLKDVFLFVEDEGQYTFNLLCEGENLLEDESFVSLLDTEEWESDAVLQYEKEQKEEEEESVADDQQPEVKNTASQDTSNKIQFIKVKSSLLDDLMNRVSELVTAQASLDIKAQESNDENLIHLSETFERLSRDIRDLSFNITLIPFDYLLQRVRRSVRTMSSELKKDISLVHEGGSINLEKSYIEKLSDPINHIIRNCLDHGIESPEEREALGKPPKGIITIKAAQEGTNILVTISDDGRGLNLDKIYNTAVKRKLIPANAQLTNKEKAELIFTLGLSTKEQVTGLSGRGVGMDVVRRNITDLRGEIYIDTAKDKGTTFTIELPLTLSIIDGFLVEVANQNYIIPMLLIEKCVEITGKDLTDEFNQLVLVDGKHIPFIDLRSAFHKEPLKEDDIRSMIVVNKKGKKGAIITDRIKGELQAVLKPIGRHYKFQDFVSSSSVLGDGNIALLLDINKLFRTHFEQY